MDPDITHWDATCARTERRTGHTEVGSGSDRLTIRRPVSRDEAIRLYERQQAAKRTSQRAERLEVTA